MRRARDGVTVVTGSVTGNGRMPERVAQRVLFGSDFYVVEDAKLEERRISVRVRSVLGEDLFRTIAEENPVRYLGQV